MTTRHTAAPLTVPLFAPYTHYSDDPLVVERSAETACLRAVLDAFVRACVLGEPKAESVLLAGARGVGKTVLATRVLRDFSTEHPDVTVIRVWMVPRDDGRNRRLFLEAVRRSCGREAPFGSVTEALDAVFRHAVDRPTVLFLDDFSEFARMLARDGSDGAALTNWCAHWQTAFEKNQRQRLFVLGLTLFADAARASLEEQACRRALAAADAHPVQELFPLTPVEIRRALRRTHPGFSPDECLTAYAMSGGLPWALNALMRRFQGEPVWTPERLTARTLEQFFVEAQLHLARSVPLSAQARLGVLCELAQGPRARDGFTCDALLSDSVERVDLAGRFASDISGDLHHLARLGLARRLEPVGENGAKRRRARWTVTEELHRMWWAFGHHPATPEWPSESALAAFREAFRLGRRQIAVRMLRSHGDALVRAGALTASGPWWNKHYANAISWVALRAGDGEQGEPVGILFADVLPDDRPVTAEDQFGLRLRAERFFEWNPAWRRLPATYVVLPLRAFADGGRDDFGVPLNGFF